MASLRCLVALLVCLVATTMPVPASCEWPPMRSPRHAATGTPYLPPHGMISDCVGSQDNALEPTPSLPPMPPTRPPREADTEMLVVPPHSTMSESADAKEQEPGSITFADHGSGLYMPANVVAAGPKGESSESGSAATAHHSPFDLASTLQEVHDYFKNATAVPAPSNASMSISNASISTPDDITVPTQPGDESVFDLDSAAADKPVLPSPAPKFPTETRPPQSQSAFKSAAMISKICDAALFAPTLLVLALH